MTSEGKNIAMRSHGLQKLERLELVLLGITIISIIIGAVTGKLIYPIVVLALSQSLSLFNRFRFQQVTRRRLNGLNSRINNQVSGAKVETASPVKMNYTLEEPKIPAPISPPSKKQEEGQKLTTHSGLKYQLRYQLKEHQEVITDLSVSPDGSYLVSVSGDQTLKLWDLPTGKLLKTLTAHSSGILAVTFLEGQEKVHLATGGYDQKIKLWQIQAKKEIEIIHEATLTDHRGSIQCLAFHPERQILLSGSYDQTVKQWRMPDGKVIATGHDPTGSIYAVTSDPSGKYFATAGGDGQVILWELGSEKQLGRLVGNIFSVQSLAISPDGQVVAAGCINGQIILWNLENKQLALLQPWLTLKGHQGPIKALAFAGKYLHSAGSDGSIYLWNLESSQPLQEIEYSSQERRPLSSLILSPDGGHLIAGDVTGKIKIWSRE